MFLSVLRKTLGYGKSRKTSPDQKSGKAIQ
jgi:hypothetical protein